jgi:4-aminobutyrate aminotransferase
MITRLNVPGPKAQALLARDQALISPSYPRDYGFVMSHGRGAEVWDVDGHRYVDFVAGIAVNSTGHSHPEIVRAIREQSERFIHISSDYYHEPMVAVCEALNDIRPTSEALRFFLCNSGTEAVEAALKLARHHTGRQYFLGFLGGFHGRSMGAVSFTASKASQRARFAPFLPGVVHVPFADPYRPLLAFDPARGDYGDAVVDYIEHVVFKQLVPADEVAGILLEPIQGEGGYIVPAPHFLPRLRALCDRHGILLIADEVQSGAGRTGKWWAIEHFGVEPDIIASAKGIASGMPFGVMMARSSLMTWGRGAHGNTYGGNPLAAVAALTTLRLLREGYLANAAEQGAYVLERLRALQAAHPAIGEVRGRGLMIGVEFIVPGSDREPFPELRDRLVHLAFEHGLLLLGCGASVVRIAPPLAIDRERIDEGLAVFAHALTLAEAELGAGARPAVSTNGQSEEHDEGDAATYADSRLMPDDEFAPHREQPLAGRGGHAI